MTSSKDHIPTLDGLRGFAALAVFVAHTAGHEYWLGSSLGFAGALGVTFFFSLSGFLMAYLYLSKAFSFENVFTYGVKRFSRIAPAYLLIRPVAKVALNLC